MSNELSPQNHNSTLENLKLEEEIRKLQLENLQLKSSPWKTPAFFASVTAFLVSLIGNAIQFYSAQISASNANQQIQLAEQKLIDERQKMQTEIEAMRQRIKNIMTDRESITAEIETATRNISAWDEALFQDEIQLKFLELEVDKAVFANEAIMAEAARRNVEHFKTTMAYKKEQRASLVQRRSELEKRLGCN